MMIERPDNFEFAMDFLGGEEEAKVRVYVERLEKQRDQLLTALKKSVIIIDGAIYCGHELNENGQDMLLDVRTTIAAVEPPCNPAA